MAESMKGLKRTDYCGMLTAADIGKKVTLMGWVAKCRNKGGIVFVDLRDRTGIVQIVTEGDAADARFASLKTESAIAVTGTVQRREAENAQLRTGEIEVIPDSLRILSESETPPFPVRDGIDTREDLRLKYRYLDLRRPELQSRIILRARMVQIIRDYMSRNGFLDIETPNLIASTPEGARDYLVPSRVHPGCFYALPQSPQLLKQLLMCSGFDRYYQIARCFRDEDLRADRQPEFTQVDMELSFADQEDVIGINTNLLQELCEKLPPIMEEYGFDSALIDGIRKAAKDIAENGIDRMTWQDAMDRYGSDKPDLRFDLPIRDVSDIVKDCGFAVFTGALENGGMVRGINAKGLGGLPRKKIDKLTEVAKTYGAKGLAWLSIAEDGSMKSSFTKFLSEEKTAELISAMDGKNGDLLLFAADSFKVVCASLGALRLHIGEEAGLIDHNAFRFVWIVDFPLLEWSDEEGRFMAMHHPFTMPNEEDWAHIDDDPGHVRAQAYDIVLNGNEIGGGSIRIHMNDIQEKMLEVLGFTPERAAEQFGFLLEAFRYGVPPHAGLAYGLDRLAMLMTGSSSIRDVIAFPKVKDASDLMMKAPSAVDAKQLEELSLSISQSKKDQD